MFRVLHSDWSEEKVTLYNRHQTHPNISDGHGNNQTPFFLYSGERSVENPGHAVSVVLILLKEPEVKFQVSLCFHGSSFLMLRNQQQLQGFFLISK